MRKAMNRERLLARARAAAARAYAPYSHFQVGAAVVVEDERGVRVVTGANVENASYSLTLCAERAALAAALTSESLSPRAPLKTVGTAPRPRITHVAVACVNVTAGAGPEHRTPCGACRQWLAELAPDAVYYVDGVPGALRLEDLLPLAFRLNGAREAPSA
jgi:cytidine deaminase